MTKPMMTALVMTKIIMITTMVLFEGPARKAEEGVVVKIRMMDYDDNNEDDKINDNSEGW